MDGVALRIDELAASTNFSGVVRVDSHGATVVERAYGMANRAYGIANTPHTKFALASGAKGFTALVAMSLIEEGRLTLDTTARSLLGADLPLIDAGVTIEHLLAHTSGIGDYLDEGADGDILDYAMPIPVHLLSEPEAYLPVLDGFPSKSAPGEQWAYNNGAFVVLAVLIERASGSSYYDLVRDRVCAPAGLHDTEFLRSDQLPGDAAVGYLHSEGLQTNTLHMPVRGAGDGGIYSTLADVHAFWRAFFDGRIVSPSTAAEMVRPRPTSDDEDDGYGLGFWLHPDSDGVKLAGYDPGVSFRTLHQPSTELVATVISNTADGAWPIARLLDGMITTRS
ncbi:MAG: serine hydrolase domain-containing protein [Actinomycetota bacterium]|nr:serine hydrolase domain-containing protein [Actinomycetota bacterium]